MDGDKCASDCISATIAVFSATSQCNNGNTHNRSSDNNNNRRKHNHTEFVIEVPTTHNHDRKDTTDWRVCKTGELEDAKAEVLEQVHRDIVNMHADIVRGFEELREEMRRVLTQSLRAVDAVVEENTRLKEEIRQLKHLY